MGSTVDQQPEGEVVRQSQEEVARRAKFFQPTHQSQSQSVIDQGNLITHKMFLLFKVETSRSQGIMVKSFHEELCSSDRSGQPDDTHNVLGSVFKHVCLKKTRTSELSKLMIDQGNLINTTLQYQTLLKYIMRSRCSTSTMS